MTIKEYLDNPFGKGSTFINKRVIYDNLMDRYKKLVNKHKRFTSFIYKEDSGYYCHIKIPSESIDEMTYDVVVFIRDSNYIENAKFQVFSNCPSFVYTYAYVFNKRKLLIESLRGFYSNEVISQDPEIRNPSRILGYEKSIFYAFNYLIEKFHRTDVLDKFSKKFDFKTMKSKIRDDDLILMQYRRYKRKQELKEKQKLKSVFKRIRKPEKEEPRKVFHRIEPKPKLQVKEKMSSSIVKKGKIHGKKKR